MDFLYAKHFGELTKYSYNVTSSGFGKAKIVSRSDSVFVKKMGCTKKFSIRFLRKHSN